MKKNKRKNDMDGYLYVNPRKKLDAIKHFGVNKSCLIIADVQLNTGDFEFFEVRVKKGKFTLFGLDYLVDDSFLVWNRTFKKYVGKYHEDMSIPVRQHIPVKEIKEQMKGNENVSYSRVVNNVEPKILKQWNTSKVIQDSLKGQKIGDGINKITIMLWVIGIISLVSFVMILNMSGLLGGKV